MREGNPNFMNGVPELLILQLLGTNEMYGYELVQAIREQTQGVVHLSEGVVYPTLHSLEVAGALKSRRKLVNGRSRVYYSITRTGTRRLNQLSGNWSTLTKALQAVLQGAGRAGAS